jgi:hypothetical protein
MSTSSTSNINKKFNDLLHKELDGFFEYLFEKAEDTDFEFTKDNLTELAKEYFPIKQAKQVKEKKERKIPDDAERCTVVKKDGTRCNGSKNKKEEYINTEYAEMCPLHVNAAKKQNEKPVEETVEEQVVDEIEKPTEVNVVEEKVKPKKKRTPKKEVISEDEL